MFVGVKVSWQYFNSILHKRMGWSGDKLLHTFCKNKVYRIIRLTFCLENNRPIVQNKRKIRIFEGLGEKQYSYKKMCINNPVIIHLYFSYESRPLIEHIQRLCLQLAPRILGGRFFVKKPITCFLVRPGVPPDIRGSTAGQAYAHARMFSGNRRPI